jgi:gamma-tubulin complex component 2
LQPPPLHQQSLEAQEAALLDDLLFVFMGLEGQYIRFADTYNPLTEKDRLAGPEFRIAAGLDPSLRDLTMTMLKMATHYAAVDTFVEVHSREEYGCVNHALCAGMRAYLARYLEMVAQLEHQLLTDASFTLHRLHLQTLPTARTFAQLYLLCHEILRRMHLLESDTHALDDLDDFENILESLRDGGGGGIGGTTVGAPGGTNGLSAKKICKGGGVLALLTHRLASMFGDPAARDLLTELLRAASRPYMAMLNEWLHHGGIRDPYAEFLIKEQRSIRKDRLEQDYTDEYWEKRYTIRDSDVPPQLEAVKEKVLLAGKYLNVVRECGGVDVTKEVQDVPETFDDPRWVSSSLLPTLPFSAALILFWLMETRFLDNVNDAYAHANSSLLNLLLTTHGLPSRLRSLKHYFFLDQSDFFSYFLELAASELKKPVKAVNVSKLQSLLDLVLRQPGSVAALDPYKEDVKVQMNEVGLTKWLMRVVSVSGIDQSSAAAGANGLHGEAYHQLSSAATASSSADDDKHNTGFSALELDYSVPFPLSLVVSRKTVLRYQLIFRYLLSLRHLETLLAGSWTEHCKAPSWRHRSSDARFEAWKRRAWTLRARMLVFVQQLLYFCTAEVIEPNWRALMARIEGSSNGGSAAAAGAVGASDDDGGVSGGRGGRGADGTAPLVTRTVDELMQDHVDFLDTCLKECMLTNSKLLRVSEPPPFPFISISSSWEVDVQLHLILSNLLRVCYVDPRQDHDDLYPLRHVHGIPFQDHHHRRSRPVRAPVATVVLLCSFL